MIDNHDVDFMAELREMHIELANAAPWERRKVSVAEVALGVVARVLVELGTDCNARDMARFALFLGMGSGEQQMLVDEDQIPLTVTAVYNDLKVFSRLGVLSMLLGLRDEEITPSAGASDCAHRKPRCAGRRGSRSFAERVPSAFRSASPPPPLSPPPPPVS